MSFMLLVDGLPLIEGTKTKEFKTIQEVATKAAFILMSNPTFEVKHLPYEDHNHLKLNNCGKTA